MKLFSANEEQRLISNRKGQIICKNMEQPFSKKCTSTEVKSQPKSLKKPLDILCVTIQTAI